MMQKIFTIYDSKAHAYLPPFFLPEAGMAVRVFSDCVNDKSHQFSKHPGDYTLFQIGTFDQNTATGFFLEARQNLGVGLEYVADPTITPESHYEEHSEPHLLSSAES